MVFILKGTGLTYNVPAKEFSGKIDASTEKPTKYDMNADGKQVLNFDASGENGLHVEITKNVPTRVHGAVNFDGKFAVGKEGGEIAVTKGQKVSGGLTVLGRIKD